MSQSVLSPRTYLFNQDVAIAVQACINTFVNSQHELDLEDMAHLMLRSTLRLSRGQRGIVVSTWSPDKTILLCHTGFVHPPLISEIPSIIKSSESLKWLSIPLNHVGRFIGTIYIEHQWTHMGPDWLIDQLKPIAPQLMIVVLSHYYSSHDAVFQHNMFLSTVSHEVRTPLNGIVGMCRLLKDHQNNRSLTKQQQSYLDVMSECTYQLLELINDILDFSRMGCDQLQLEPHVFQLSQCLDEVYDLVFLRIQQKQLQWILEVDSSNLNCQLLGDKKRIRQILLNLINNSIKYTDNGFIRVKVAIVTPPPPPSSSPEQITSSSSSSLSFHDCRLQVEVYDSGVGIPTEHLDHVFKSFHQVKRQQPQCEGVGLGLAICKKLCRLMNGDIFVKHSQTNGIDHGTCICFDLPLSKTPALVSNQQQQQQMPFILLIHNDTSYRLQLLQHLYQWLGNQVQILSCQQWEEAQIYFQQHPIDVCLSDCDHHHHQQTNVVYVDLRTNDLDGIQQQVTKWFSNLKSLLSSPLPPSTPCPIPSFPLPPSTPCPLSPSPLLYCSILVVEDNTFNLFVITEMLKNTTNINCRVDVAKTGPEAIEKAVMKTYDIILMDLLLPGVDGITATTQILQFCKHRNIQHPPVIVALTALVTTETQQRCKQAGMKAFLSKPIDQTELLTMINVIVRKRSN